MRPCPPACAQTGGCGEKVIFVLDSAGLVWTSSLWISGSFLLWQEAAGDDPSVPG